MIILRANLQSYAAFVFFTLLLTLDSGYGVGAIISLFLFFYFFKDLGVNNLLFKEKFFAFVIVFLAFFWGVEYEGGINFGENFFKYLAGSLVFVCAIFVRVKLPFFVTGLIAGCVLSFVIALCQYESIGRAAGFTNAIRFGNIALWMGCACLIFFVFSKLNGFLKFGLLVAFACGLGASLLSLSRGGWIFLFILPWILIFAVDDVRRRVRLTFVGLFFIITLIVFGGQIEFIEKRIIEAKNEVAGYVDKKPGSATTSVGARLEQWKLAWHMGLEKPWLGWGEMGYLRGREIYVEKGLADPSVVNFGHAHNEILNIFVKKGFFGIFGMLLIYCAPLFIFWPNKNMIKKLGGENLGKYKSLCLIGLSIPISYFVFGMTEYFFYLNIGHIFYLFSIIYTYSALKEVESESDGR